MNNSDIVISINDEKYTHIELEYSALITASDNPYLKNDDIICIAKLKRNKLDYIREKDIVAFTSNNHGFLFHLYRVEDLNKLEFKFHPLSNFLNKKSFILKKADLEDSALIGKVLYTINRLNNAFFIKMSHDESPN